MRMHKFKTVPGQAIGTVAYVDLDAVSAVMAGPGLQTVLNLPGGGPLYVDMPIDDVLALICPPAAPDTFEEDLARRRDLWDAIMGREKPADTPELASFGATAYRVANGLEDRPMTAEPEDKPYYDLSSLDPPPADGLRRAAGLEDRPKTAEDDYIGPYAADAGGHRIDELYRTVRALIGQADAYWPKWVRDYVDTRIDQIEGRG